MKTVTELQAELAALEAITQAAEKAEAAARVALVEAKERIRKALMPVDAREGIRRAFGKLRKAGWTARMSFMCCQGCGCAALAEAPYNLKEGDNHVFYHKQDAERLAKDNGTWMTWGGDGKQIVAALRAEGLRVQWNGTEAERIYATGNKFERGDKVGVTGPGGHGSLGIGTVERVSREDATMFMVRFHEDKAPEKIPAEAMTLVGSAA